MDGLQEQINNELKGICAILPSIRNGDKLRIFNENKETIFIIRDVRDLYHIEGAYYDEWIFCKTALNHYNNENIYIEIDLEHYYNYVYEFNLKPWTKRYGRMEFKQTPKSYLNQRILDLKEFCKNNTVTIKWR